MQLSKDITVLSAEAIPFLEEKLNAKFLLETNLQAYGNPVLVFYSEVAHTRGSNYAGFYMRDGIPYIIDAIKVESIEFVGIEEDGIVYHSRYGHDFRSTPKGAAIDGGQLGSNRTIGYANAGFPKSVSFTIKAGEIIFA